jgi:hypothetical protein
MKRAATLIAAGILLLTTVASVASAIEPEREMYVERERRYGPPIVIDVWTNKGEGAVYRPGERIRVYFRASADCYVTLYNVDAQGYVHLLFPTRAFESHFVHGGVTYRIPSRGDPYDLTIGRVPGIEYIEAVASAAPFGRAMPWYLDPEYSEWGYEENPWTVFGEDYDYYADDYDYYADIGIVRGDPFLGIQRINVRLIPERYAPHEYATAYTSFYVSSRVPYPRYVCYDCHWSYPHFDPYGAGCVVFDIRIDRTWVYTPRVYVTDYRPKYYYRVKDTAPVVYKDKRHFWSSKDGLRTLKTEFDIQKPSSEVWKPKAAPGGEIQWIKELGPSGLKTWKSGKVPSYSPKLEQLRQKLQTQGVLKSKQYEGTSKGKGEVSRDRDRETYQEQEKQSLDQKARKQETYEKSKQKGVTEEEKSKKKTQDEKEQSSKQKGNGKEKR